MTNEEIDRGSSDDGSDSDEVGSLLQVNLVVLTFMLQFLWLNIVAFNPPLPFRPIEAVQPESSGNFDSH